MTRRICNMCGKDFDIWDEQEDFSIHTRAGYGSEFDEEEIDLDLCCGCFDHMMLEYIIPKCKHVPVTNWTKNDAAVALLRQGENDDNPNGRR